MGVRPASPIELLLLPMNQPLFIIQNKGSSGAYDESGLAQSITRSFDHVPSASKTYFAELKDYIHGLGCKRGPLFLTDKREREKYLTLNRRWKQYISKEYVLHQLRHTKATEMLHEERGNASPCTRVPEPHRLQYHDTLYDGRGETRRSSENLFKRPV
jgi:integrase